MAAEEEVEDVLAPGMRSFWSGTITFGLVSVPVSLFPATVRRRVSFRMLGPQGAPVERLYVCSKDEAELEADDIVRGYEVSKGKFVIVTDDELEAIEPRKSREIDLKTFVPREEIDPMYFDRGYFLAPAGGSNKAYRLLAEVMERTRRAGIATFVMRGKEYLVAILAENGILRAETLRFAEELRSPADVGLPKQTNAKPADVKKFETAITKKSGPLNISLMVDAYAKRVEDLVAKKQKRKEDVVRVEAPAPEEEAGTVVDIMEALRRSLGQSSTARRAPAKRSSAKKSARKAPRKRAAAKRK